MATIIKKYNNFANNETQAILYVDTIDDEAYITAIKTEMAKELRLMRDSRATYGNNSLDNEIILQNANSLVSDVNSKVIMNPNANTDFVLVEDFTISSYKLTLYKRNVANYILWSTVYYSNICEIYYAECNRLAPKRKIPVDPQQRFESELSAAVSVFKKRAERDGVREFYGNKK